MSEDRDEDGDQGMGPGTNKAQTELDEVQEDRSKVERSQDKESVRMIYSTFAGFLMILVTILAFLNPYFLLWSEVPDGSLDVPESDTRVDLACSAISVLFGLICLAGAIASIKRTNWTLAMIGALLGSLTVSVCALNLLLGLLALGLIVKTRKEFLESLPKE